MKKALLTLPLLLTACATPPEPYGPVPTERQIEWQKMEMNMFLHFGPNTFTAVDWGTGTEKEEIFNPAAMDCRQWADIAKASGMKGMILTAKHHDGFCLWPNPVSRHTVSQSKWKDGKGDVLKEFAQACSATGVQMGIYISPWDRYDPTYGTDGYNDVYIKTLESALRYGPVFEEWFDGACGEGENGKRQVYDWDAYHSTVRRLQPDALIFPGDMRWVGNESGVADKTCWSKMFGDSKVPTDADSVGTSWVPVETDVSIRPTWFYKQAEDTLVKSLQKLLDIYYTSVGRNSVLLLNVPPDMNGRIAPEDSVRLMEFRAAIDSIYSTDCTAGARITASDTRGCAYSPKNLLDGDYDSYWAPGDDTREATVTLSFDTKKTFNRVLLMEYIPLGQRISAFRIDALSDSGEWTEIARETTIGYKRIVPVARTSTTSVRITIDSACACPVLNWISLLTDDYMPENYR